MHLDYPGHATFLSSKMLDFVGALVNLCLCCDRMATIVRGYETDHEYFLACLRYVGYDEGGQLTEAIRRRPFAVVLFDEVEKAHVSVFNTLLQILDDGRLTDGQGRTVDFTSTVIIMTSNLGSEHLLAGMAGDQMLAKAKTKVLSEVSHAILSANLAKERASLTNYCISNFCLA